MTEYKPLLIKYKQKMATIGDKSITPPIGGMKRRKIDKYGSTSLAIHCPIALDCALGNHESKIYTMIMKK
jgi:hypothetical protein